MCVKMQSSFFFMPSDRGISPFGPSSWRPSSPRFFRLYPGFLLGTVAGYFDSHALSGGGCSLRLLSAPLCAPPKVKNFRCSFLRVVRHISGASLRHIPPLTVFFFLSLRPGYLTLPVPPAGGPPLPGTAGFTPAYSRGWEPLPGTVDSHALSGGGTFVVSLLGTSLCSLGNDVSGVVVWVVL